MWDDILQHAGDLFGIYVGGQTAKAEADARARAAQAQADAYRSIAESQNTAGMTALGVQSDLVQQLLIAGVIVLVVWAVAKR